MQYMMDLNECRTEISKDDIENLIEDEFVSLDDFIFKVKWLLIAYMILSNNWTYDLHEQSHSSDLCHVALTHVLFGQLSFLDLRPQTFNL